MVSDTILRCFFKSYNIPQNGYRSIHLASLKVISAVCACFGVHSGFLPGWKNCVCYERSEGNDVSRFFAGAGELDSSTKELKPFVVRVAEGLGGVWRGPRCQ